MSRVEEMIAIRAAPAQVMRQFVAVDRMKEWVAPDVAITSQSRAATLAPGHRFRLTPIGGPAFDYTVEGATDREVAMAFAGPWSGEERWSFIPDGADTIARRVYEVRDPGGLIGLAWATVGRALVMAHFKLELVRFRDMVERDPGPLAEIEGRGGPVHTFDVDEG